MQEEITQICFKKDGKFFPEIIEVNGRTYKLDTETFVYLEQQPTTDLTPEEAELMSNPIGYYGRAWRRFMEENYPEEIPSLVSRLKWELIPRQIDKEAEEMAWNLEKQYARKNPRPKTFLEIEKWERMKRLEVDHRVMEDVVLQYRS